MEGKKCMVLFCKNRGSIPGIKYFRLTATRRNSWLRALGRDPDPNIERLTDSNRVCSLHFADDDIFVLGNRLCLKPGAIPSKQLGIRRPFAPLQVMQPEATLSSINQEEDEAGVSCIQQNKERNKHEQLQQHMSFVPSFSPSSSVKSDDQIVLEEGLSYQNFEICMEDAENKDSYDKSPAPSSSTLSGDSTDGQFDLHSILTIIYVYLGIFLLCSFKDETETPRIKQLKRKIQGLKSSSSDSEGYKGECKRARKDIKIRHSYGKNPRSMIEKLKAVSLKQNILREKLKGSKKRVIRLSRKVTTLKNLIVHLKNKNLLDDAAITVLEKTYSGIPLILLKRAITNMRLNKRGKKQNREPFSPELRSFALTLQFYSSKAYNYVRSTFNLALPAPSTIRSWVTNINCEPGFSDCSFATLERTVQKNIGNNKLTLCSLMLDEMAIKKQIELRGSKIWGYEDFGTEIQNDLMKCATEALTLMVVAINDSWKIPVGYFLISSLSGRVKANIVNEAIRRLISIVVKVASVTCDGPSAHFTMAESLGADIRDMDNLKTYFKNSDDSHSYVVFDAAHMLKLFRNNWASLGLFIDGDGNKIDFQYITKLGKIQDEEFCRLGTKLRKAHLQWKSHKMKVNLAAQTLSRSVADALEFLLEIGHPDFKNAKPTIIFIRIVDELFDLANSRNPFGRGTKSPLQKANEEFWKPKIIHGMEYLKKIKNSRGDLLITTRNKTPIRGMCITLTSLLGLYNDLVSCQNSPLSYLLTYKFSQDHLELFFCCLRGRNGWNNNPTAYQFYYTYKRLALNMDIRAVTGNCSILDDTHILTTSSKKIIMPSLTTDDMSLIKKYSIDINDMIVHEEDFEGVIKVLPHLSLISENVVAYIAGFLLKVLKKSIKCVECLECITNPERQQSLNLLLFNIKNKGGLITPKNNLINICLFIEKKIRQTLLISNQFMPKEKNFINVFTTEVSMYLFENHYLDEIDQHLFLSPFSEEPHRMKLIKLITKITSDF